MTESIHFTDGDIECSCNPLRLTIAPDGAISRIAGGPLEEPIDVTPADELSAVGWMARNILSWEERAVPALQATGEPPHE